MKFCDERIQRHLLNGGKIKRIDENCCIGYRPIKFINDTLCFANKSNDYYILSKNNLTTNDQEIVEPEYNWDKIIKDKVLCIFSDYEDFRTFNISTLIKINLNNNTYRTNNNNIIYGYCKLFNPNDFNIAKDLKEYEE